MPKPEPFELPEPFATWNTRNLHWKMTGAVETYLYDIALSLRRLVEIAEVEQRRK